MHQYLSCLVTKPTKSPVRPAKTQISLGIHPVWSESSLCTHWVAKEASFLHADSEDSQADLSLCWTHIPFCWFVTRRLIWELFDLLFYLVFSCIYIHNTRDNITQGPRHEIIIIIINRWVSDATAWTLVSSPEQSYSQRQRWISQMFKFLGPHYFQMLWCIWFMFGMMIDIGPKFYGVPFLS